jgi:hypothetical protein
MSTIVSATRPPHPDPTHPPPPEPPEPPEPPPPPEPPEPPPPPEPTPPPPQTPSDPESAEGAEEERVALEDEPSRCDAIEFTYRNYRVPRGMEGFLLSILFGSWQRWEGDLSTLNGVREARQLQAGQQVRLMLPLHEWRLFTLQPQEGAAELRAALGCQEAHINTCLMIVQLWNPHLDLRALRKGDQLLLNPSLLRPEAFSADVYRRMEKVKRLRGVRLPRPRLTAPQGCQVTPLRSTESTQ